ncbi:MAG: ribonuclease P protein component [Flavobacteriales bacterium]|nr:ribonuclease P protein component [Flavobacteriales bacterium]
MIITSRNTDQGLGKEERLSRKKIIEAVFESGESIKTTSFVLLYQFVEIPGTFPAQVLFSASKKLYKAAHDRNRVRRLMREAYRKQKWKHYLALEEQQQQAALLFIFTGRQLPDHEYVFGKISELIKRFIQKIPLSESNKKS